MNEVNERKQEDIEITAPETAADHNANPEKETSPAEAKPAEKEKSRKGKKRKKAKIALPAAALLLVIALLFGMVVGYGMGRNVGSQRLKEAEAQVAALTVAFEEAAGSPVYDAFSEELTGENQSALSELAGGAPMDGGVGEHLSEDALLGEMLDGETQAPVVVAEYEGGVLMSDEVAVEYEEQLAALVFAGYSEEEVASTLLNEVMQYMVVDRLLEKNAKEMGLYDLTAGDHAQIDAEAEEIYNEQLNFYRDFVDTTGMTDAEATGAVKNYLLENEGTSLDTVRAELEETWWVQKMFDEITGDVAISDADLQETYDALLAEQKESFEAYADDYEFAQMSGETILYNLPGYRAVRMLLVAMEDSEDLEKAYVLSDEIAQLDPEKDAELIAQYRAEIESCYTQPEAEAKQLLDRLNGGEDFIQLMAEAGDDDGMKSAPLNETGYYVSGDSLLYSPEMISAAMALENPGDISGIVRVEDGVCILQYVGEVPAGEVPLKDVHDHLMQQTLVNAQYDAYEAKVDEWLKEAKAVYYPERMQ